MKGNSVILLVGTCILVTVGRQQVVRGQVEESAPTLKFPSFVTAYDLATPETLLYLRLLEDTIEGDEPDEWTILSGIGGQLGDWIEQFIDAQRIATTIAEAMPIGGQPPLRQVEEIVADCAKILGVKKPVIYVRNSPLTTCYVTSVEDGHFLVLTSGLLKLFENRPAELRFIVGRELGHLKCNQIRLKTAASAILAAVESINLAVVPDEYQVVLPTLSLGRMFTYAREAEISADRAGLLCCQDPNVAYEALLRLLHGLGADSSWIDPRAPDFDPLIVIKDFQKWQDRPFVEFVMHVKRFSSMAPFIPERVAALKQWADAKQHLAILNRTAPLNTDQLVVVKRITLRGVAPRSDPANPYVVCHVGGMKLFTTVSISDVTSASWKDINKAHGCLDGQPLFFEIWNDVIGTDPLLGAAMIHAKKNETSYSVPIVWDWKDRTGIARQGIAEIEVEFKSRAK